jgi:hypothetical protein
MKVCPVQKYDMKNTMDHYAATGQVLGKGTHDLEGYELEGKGYFGPGELPIFESGFFDMPHGDAAEWAFDQFKEKAKSTGGAITDDMIEDFKRNMNRSLSLSDDNVAMMDQDSDYI